MTATVAADKGDAGIKIVSSKLTVDRLRAEGARCGEFAAVAQGSRRRCPVSNAYRGTMEITVDAKVA